MIDLRPLKSGMYKEYLSNLLRRTTNERGRFDYMGEWKA